VAGIGNIFLGDDGFGVVVAGRLIARLVDRPAPPGVRYADFGIRGVHLAYELLDGYDALVLVDAVPFGESPGTVAVVPAGEAGAALAALRADPHGTDAARVGEIRSDPPGIVVLVTPLGGTRIVDMLVGDPLPRIC
jgi:hydrogenase maturation protease